MKASTIAAISTPSGSGGIGIIKVSGPDAIGIARSVFQPKSFTGPSENHTRSHPDYKPRRMYYGHIIDPGTGQTIDEVLFVIMPAPYSYTAEDVVEIQAHAGTLVLKTILNLLIEKGARLAEPGEFTKRAFLNGRIDLTQAEAVIDIINARSKSAVDMATTHMTGGLGRAVASLRSALSEILAVVDAAIDFSDDTDIPVDTEEMARRLEQGVVFRLKDMVRRWEDENFLREGLKVVIVGGPNVGKSSLMNRLISRERAIVTDIPGTTRDFIEESFTTRGIPIVVTDTAGIHDEPDTIEEIGIEKAWDYIAAADVILFTVDAGRPVVKADLNLLKRLEHKKRILVVNKTDLPARDIHFTPPEEWTEIPCMETSALYNRGIDELKGLIADIAFDFTTDTRPKIVPNLRQKLAMEKCMRFATAASRGLQQDAPLEMVSDDLRSSLSALGEITGEHIGGELLDKIFSRFCIGK